MAVPLLVLVGTAVYLLYLRGPKRLADYVVSLNSRSLRIVQSSDPPQCNILIIENDESLSCTNPVAQRVVSVAGEALRKECEDWVKNFGNPLPGEKASTSGGRIAVRSIFHVITNEEQDLQFLRDLFREELREASGMGQKVAMSLLGLSSGYSLEEYSKVLAEECLALLNDRAGLKMEELVIWCTDVTQFAAISRAFN